MSVSEFESELRAFDNSPAPANATVFYGSSSIRMWDRIADYFPEIAVVNRGFGGSTLAECLHLLPRLVYPLSPAALVLYAADNDLDQGASPEHAVYLYREFMKRMNENLPGVPVAFVSVKPSPARFWNIANIRRTNSLIQEAVPEYPGAEYVDVASKMMSPSGGSRPDLFSGDGLHMNAQGYNLWSAEIRAWLERIGALNGN